MKPVIGRNSQDSRSCPAGGSWKRLIQKRGVLLREKRMQGASLCAKERRYGKNLLPCHWLCIRAGTICGDHCPGAPGQKRRTIGSCNPGTANITRQMGKAWGLLVLAGDLLKTAAACWLCAALFPELGRLVYLWAGLGATLGHNFPVWLGFRGGKGVATTCACFCFCFPRSGADPASCWEVLWCWPRDICRWLPW